MEPSANKFSAWNKGLDAARGDYVLFLSCKDFIFPYTAVLLYDILNPKLTAKTKELKSYLTCANIENYLFNIICATQIFTEDDGGNMSITEFPDKKFSVQTDAALTGLNGIAELNIPAEQKLMSLATKGVNNFVATKFFKRKFLIDNKITFKKMEGGGTDAELLFLVETFLATDKITFVPQVFSGRLK